MKTIIILTVFIVALIQLTQGQVRPGDFRPLQDRPRPDRPRPDAAALPRPDEADADADKDAASNFDAAVIEEAPDADIDISDPSTVDFIQISDDQERRPREKFYVVVDDGYKPGDIVPEIVTTAVKRYLSQYSLTRPRTWYWEVCVRCCPRFWYYHARCIFKGRCIFVPIFRYLPCSYYKYEL